MVSKTLVANGLPCAPCGLNADWCVSAWCFGPGAPNVNEEPTLYLLDTEDDNDTYELVSRFVVADGESQIVPVYRGSLSDCCARLRCELGLN